MGTSKVDGRESTYLHIQEYSLPVAWGFLVGAMSVPQSEGLIYFPVHREPEAPGI